MSGKTIRWTTTAAAAAVLAAGSAMAVSTPASATVENPCAHPGWRENQPTSGGIVGDPSNIRSGPYLDCAPNGVGHPGDSVTFYCWRTGDTYNGISSWTFLMDWTRGVRGWVNDSLLTNVGSPNQC